MCYFDPQLHLRFGNTRGAVAGAAVGIGVGARAIGAARAMGAARM